MGNFSEQPADRIGYIGRSEAAGVLPAIGISNVGWAHAVLCPTFAVMMSPPVQNGGQHQTASYVCAPFVGQRRAFTQPTILFGLLKAEWGVRLEEMDAAIKQHTKAKFHGCD